MYTVYIDVRHLVAESDGGIADTTRIQNQKIKTENRRVLPILLPAGSLKISQHQQFSSNLRENAKTFETTAVMTPDK